MPRSLGFSRAIVLLASALALIAAGQAQRPKVTSGVELIAVDVEAVTGSGEPVAGLQPSDFDVRIDGKPRRVVSAAFIRHGVATSARAPAPAIAPAGVAEPALSAPPRRLYLIAVDEHSFKPGNSQAAMRAAAGFVDRLRPEDLVGVYAYPTGFAHVDFTTDHALVKSALSRIAGLFEPPNGEFHLSLSEIIDINASDPQIFARVVARECHGDTVYCPPQVKSEAMALAAFLEMRVAQSLGGLRDLIDGLAAIPERKTLVLVSGGLIANDRIGGRPDAAGQALFVGAAALRANVNLYVLHLDTSFQEGLADPIPDHIATLFRDNVASGTGLDMIAGAGGGAMLRVDYGGLDIAFARVLRETSAHYVLGVAVEEADRNGKLHRISVRLKRRGTTLRSRSVVLIPRPGAVSVDVAVPPADEMPPELPQTPIAKPDGRTPSLAVILKSAAAYLDSYEQQAAAIVSEETYVQKSPDPDPQTHAVTRQLRSDMLIVPDATVGWLGFRDVFEVDGQSVHDRSERLSQLFMHPETDRMNQARRILMESSRYNLRNDITRTINMPMMALRFLRLVDQHRSKFTLDGLQTVDGVPAALVRFEERGDPRMIQSDDEAAARGAFWIEPGTGRVVKTELLFDTRSGTRLRVRVRVSYAKPPQLDAWVPVSMDEDYRLGKGTLAVEGHATYANFRKFTVQTKEVIKRP